MERTEKRFANYSSAGLLCGTDGLPHLISDPGLALRYGHAGETLVRARLKWCCASMQASCTASLGWQCCTCIISGTGSLKDGIAQGACND